MDKRNLRHRRYERYDNMEIPPACLEPVIIDGKELLALAYPGGSVMRKEKALQILEQLIEFYKTIEQKDINEYNHVTRFKEEA